MRRCLKCDRDKPADQFYANAGTSWCRECFRIYMRERRAAWAVPNKLPDTKRCGHCEADKPLEQFGRLIGTSTGRHSWCRSCQAERARRRRAANPDSVRRTKYGMPSGQYDELLRAQGGACAICRRQRRLVVDHDHATGDVRGLLCKPCNSALGFLEDSPSSLMAAITYLSRHVRQVA